jgi:CHASE2 domain-containing sensor protein
LRARRRDHDESPRTAAKANRAAAHAVARQKMKNAWTRRSKLTREVLRGLVVTVALVVAKVGFEHTDIAQRLDLLGFEFLQSRLSTFQDKSRLPVLVVDISGIRGGRGDEVTPRAPLMALIDAIARDRPRAIAVDIDFSPNETGLLSEDDPAFFEHCLSLTAQVPIVLGVYRARAAGPDSWLGLPRYRALAANIAIPLEGSNRTTTRAPRWTAPRSDGASLPTMAYALASAYRATAPAPSPSAWVRWLADVPGSAASEDGPASSLVNYSKLAQLRHEMIATRTPQSVAEFKSFYRGRMVVLGDANDEESTDKFNPPIGGVTPGVYFHAAAAYTFAVEPLYELKPVVRLLLDALLALPILLVSWLRHRPRRAAASPTDSGYERLLRQADAWYGALAMAGVALLGVLLVGHFAIMWTDFVLVILALPIHRFVERVIEDR